MNNKKERFKLSKKGAVSGLVVSSCAVIAMVGVYTFNQFRGENDIQNEVASDENVAPLDLSETEPANTDDIVNPEINIVEEEPDVTKEELIVDGTTVEQAEVVTPAPIANAAVNFSETDTLVTPIVGDIILEYSMDKSIYFPTLDQYKRNPAIVIQGTVGSEVVSSSRGIIEMIETAPTTGTTITVDMGNNYHAVYGQLSDVSVKEGQLVNQGEVIGLVAEPTKYYVSEGPNVYFELIKDGNSVNPVDYFE